MPKSVSLNASDTILFEVSNEAELGNISEEQNIEKR
jgi:hypothetical protein